MPAHTVGTGAATLPWLYTCHINSLVNRRRHSCGMLAALVGLATFDATVS